ncbi:MAG: amidohydrolase family protein, partial [Clostridiaceae bacterium]|nr:amidohydrolase family protein [Clostridiaceae bacterium]
LYPDTGLPHPRLYGTFPRVMEKYVKDEKILSIEQAVKKMTSSPAKRLDLKGRGVVKEGYKADLLLFDLENIRETSTYISPANFGKGFDYIFVNGKVAVENDKISDVNNGECIF